jgi:hypothetical protein
VSNTDLNSVYSTIITHEMLPFASPLGASSKRLFEYTNPIPITHRDIFNPCVLSELSQTQLKVSQKEQRHISKTPYKVLDAPELQDDFYLNLVDWSSTNYLGVGLGSCVYLWSANNSKVTKLCDLGDDKITSVNWAQNVS